MLSIGVGLELPEEAVTETFAILGKRGVGKTTTARVLTEELLEVGLPVLILDPTGVWLVAHLCRWQAGRLPGGHLRR